jgi:hypothetical protein
MGIDQLIPRADLFLYFQSLNGGYLALATQRGKVTGLFASQV